MSDSTAQSSGGSRAEKPLRAAPKMSFGRWVTQMGWRHAIAIVAVLFAMFPVLYIINVALNPVGSLSPSCPPDRTGIVGTDLPAARDGELSRTSRRGAHQTT